MEDTCLIIHSHDGNLESGHIHDWEGVTIVFAKDPAGNGDDWWYRAVSGTFSHAINPHNGSRMPSGRTIQSPLRSRLVQI